MIKPCPFCGSDVYLEKLPLWRTYNDGTTHGYYHSYEYDIHCEKCGRLIKQKSNRQKFCDECAEENDRKSKLEWWHKNKN